MHVVFDCDGTLLDTNGEFKLFPGILRLIQLLHSEGHQIYVWTGRDPRSTQQLMNALGVAPYLSDTRSAGQCAGKPSSEGLRQMLTGVSPSQCVVIGDSWADMAGAREWGAHGIGAVWNSQVDGETLREYGAQSLAVTPEDCYNLLLRLCPKE